MNSLDRVNFKQHCRSIEFLAIATNASSGTADADKPNRVAVASCKLCALVNAPTCSAVTPWGLFLSPVWAVRAFCTAAALPAGS